MARWSDLRRAGGAVIAALLVTLSLGPAMDSLICHADGVTIAAAEPADTTIHASDDSPAHQGEQHPGVCVHGHCHHAAAVADTGSQWPLRPAMRQAHAIAGQPVAIADRQFDLERPPRA